MVVILHFTLSTISRQLHIIYAGAGGHPVSSLVREALAKQKFFPQIGPDRW